MDSLYHIYVHVCVCVCVTMPSGITVYYYVILCHVFGVTDSRFQLPKITPGSAELESSHRLWVTTGWLEVTAVGVRCHD